MSMNYMPSYSCPYGGACQQLTLAGIYNLDTHIGDCHLTTSSIIHCPAKNCMEWFNTGRDVILHLSVEHKALFEACQLGVTQLVMQPLQVRQHPTPQPPPPKPFTPEPPVPESPAPDSPALESPAFELYAPDSPPAPEYHSTLEFLASESPTPQSPLPQPTTMNCGICHRSDIKDEHQLRVHQAIAHLSARSRYCTHPDCEGEFVVLGQPPSRFKHMQDEHAFLCEYPECEMELFESEVDLALHFEHLHSQGILWSEVEYESEGEGRG